MQRLYIYAELLIELEPGFDVNYVNLTLFYRPSLPISKFQATRLDKE